MDSQPRTLRARNPRPGGSRNGHGHCLLCGELNPWSWRLSFVGGEAGGVRATFRPDARLQGYDGILHGGVTAALLDASMTHCLFHLGVQGVTGDLHVRFLKPIPCATRLDLRAWVLSTAPPLTRLRAEVSYEGGLMAWAEATFMDRARSKARGGAPQSTHRSR